MPERKYSVAEIDRMRDSVAELVQAENRARRSDWWQIDSHKQQARVEDRLRTYMMAGVEPEEIDKASADAMKRFFSTDVTVTAALRDIKDAAAESGWEVRGGASKSFDFDSRKWTGAKY